MIRIAGQPGSGQLSSNVSRHMQPADHTAILRRTGWALIAVGLLDIAAMIYTVSRGMSYSSSLNIFAVVAGFFLLRGNLMVAGAVRWFAVFLLAGTSSLLLAWPFMQPIGLTLTQVRLSPFLTAASATFALAVLAFLFWTQRQLGLPAVLAAHAAAHRKSHRMRKPAAIGVGLVILLAVLIPALLGGSAGTRAKSLAEQQLGVGYQYHVSSLNYSTNSQGASYTANVTAWSDREIRTVAVEWSE
jgi:hypothetical protein